jgi:hypothetical protein
MKVFISYSTQDSKLAESLFEEAEGAGADVFKWGRTEIIGKPTWPQILGWINQSDVFVVLISSSALASNPVQDEIDQAAYSYSNRRKPEKIVAAILERGVEPPVIIERFARVDFTDFDSGLVRLMGQLGLKRRSGIGRLTGNLKPVTPLPDPGELFRQFKLSNPDPLPANLWSLDAAKIVTNYNNVKPKEISETTRKGHLDQILAEFSGKEPGTGSPFSIYDDLLRKLAEPLKPAVKTAAKPSISELLLSLDLYKGSVAGIDRVPPPENPRDFKLGSLTSIVLVPPQLTGKVTSTTILAGTFQLTWTPSAGATRYILERAGESEFQKTKLIYEGSETRYDDHEIRVFDYYYYRVKAVGPSFPWLYGGERESGWSNVIPGTLV